jgi:hypothetical protein
MEGLFSPCTRLYDLLVENYEDGVDQPVQPIQELNLDVSTEEILSAERLHIRRLVRDVGK